MKRKIMRTVVVAAGTLMLLAAGNAAESFWIGGAEGKWNTAENWDPVGVPNVKDSVAVFTNAATISMSGAFCEIHARGGDLTINHTYRVTVVGNSKNEVVVDVADGYTVTFTITGNIFYGRRSLTFVKSGGGRLNLPSGLGWDTDSTNNIYKDIDIRGGVLYVADGNSRGLRTVDGYVHIANGATFLQGDGANALRDNTVVEIDEGGTLNCNNKQFKLRGIIGSGTVKGLGQSTYPVTLRGEGREKGSQGVFSGNIASGSVKMASTNGYQFVIRSPGTTYADVQTWDAYIQDAEESDTGFKKDGYGTLRIGNYVVSSGPVVMSAGKIDFVANTLWLLGKGALQIDRGLIAIKQLRDNFEIAANDGAKVTVNGPSAIRLDAAGADLKIGAPGATSSPFVFGENGVFAFCLAAEGGKYITLTNDVITVNGGLPAGLPVFAYYQYLTSGATHTRKFGYNFIPVKTNSDNLLIFSGADCTNSFPVTGSGATVLKRNDTILTVPANVAPISALHVYGGAYGSSTMNTQNRIGGVNIPEGVTLSVGDGVRGIVLLNNYYFLDDYGWARIQGEGTLDFGSSRGLVVASDCYESYNKTPTIPFPAQLNCRLAGTAGVSFVSPLTTDLSVAETKTSDYWNGLVGDYMRAVEVGGNNVYTGGTRIDGMVVQPLQETSLGEDAVTVVGDTNGGGELNFTSKYVGKTFGNALTISGVGYTSSAKETIWGKRAAISVFNKRIRLTGDITLAGDATMATSGENAQIVLEGAIAGEGTLQVTAGKVVVRKDAYAAYMAGKIVAASGAEIDARSPAELIMIVR